MGIVREAAERMHRGAWAIEPETGRRTYISEHWHTAGAHDLAARGVTMRASNGSAIFEFDGIA